MQNASKLMHEKYLNKIEEASATGSQKESKHTGSFKNWKASQSQKNNESLALSNKSVSVTKQFDNSDKNDTSPRDVSNPSNDNYVSPDDGLPDKKLSIFDTSGVNEDTEINQPLD